jgi:5-methylcytosine-specific restriction endonuclease McrA
MNALVTHTDSGRFDLAALSDEALLVGTRRLVASANHTLAALLAHLAEVEARGIHRVRACSSLYTYCIYELRMSEDAAFRRAKAARLCRRFLALYDAVAAGELHLTGLLMLGAHLTQDNCGEVLARARFRSKREIAKLVRELDPLPDVPARVEPLGPELATPRAPTWGQFAASFNPVRELPPGERPADWIDGAADGDADYDGANERSESTPAPARAAQRYKVQFTASQEYVELLERACDLLSHAVPDRSIEEVHLRALRELVAMLEKKKYAATDKPRRRGDGDKTAASKSSGGDNPRRRGADNSAESLRRANAGPRRRGIPAAVRRAVRERDGARCTFVDARGQRCLETALLELHHEVPFARGGPATAENLRLRCRAHNALAAERDFGRGFMQAADTAAGRVSAGRHQAASAPPCRWDLSRTRSPASRSACAAPAGRACA